MSRLTSEIMLALKAVMQTNITTVGNFHQPCFIPHPQYKYEKNILKAI